MTRHLSELLMATEPGFQLRLQQLERGAGLPKHDIRLSTEVMHGMQAKLRELGLDPHDTHGQELYASLGQRLKADEKRFAEALKGRSTQSDDPIAHVAHVLSQEITPKSVSALKGSVAKKLLRANLPKKTMKQLGYRSADSMLKHETVASIFAGAWLIETDNWAKKMLTSYTKLTPADFEIRPLSIEHPSSKRWQLLSESVVAFKKQSVLSLKELGAVVLLPLPKQPPELPTLMTSVLTLHAVNDIRAASTFLKLHQVEAHFGQIVRSVVTGEPMLEARVLDEKVSWNSIQLYYARFGQALRSDIFERFSPMVHAEDLSWHSVEHLLARLEPSLQFWIDTSYLGLLHDRLPVSCNLTDQVLAHANKLSFEQRLTHYFRHNLMTELSIRYMTHDKLEQVIDSAFGKQLAFETVRA